MSTIDYDEVPYPSTPRPATQPSRLLALGRLHGLETASPAACRTLELGCGDGGNLLAAASLWPESEFLGIDLSPAHVARGQEQAAALKLTNIRFEVADIAALEPGFQTFDCIVAHGVFSWVPRPVQERILALYQGCLAPAGVGTLGLKTYPGWHLFSGARDVLRWGAQQRGGPAQDQLAAGLETLDLLAEFAPADTLHEATLRYLQHTLRGREAHYLVHEYLEPINAPVRYEELAAWTGEHRLRLLCDAHYAEAVPETQVPEAAWARFVALAGDDPVARQQLLDLLVNRSFRRPLLVHAEAPVADPRPEALAALWLTPGPAEEVAGDDPLLQAALASLRAAPSRTLAFSALAAEADGARQALGEALLAGVRSGALEVLAHDPGCAAEPGERPRAYPYARLCATRMGLVTNLRQEPIQLDGLSLALLTRIDGERDRAALLEQLVGLVRSGALGLTAPDGSPLSDEQARELLAPALEESLGVLASAGILLPARQTPPAR